MKNTTSTKLYFLIGIFILGFLSLYYINNVFLGLNKKLDHQTNNLEAKTKIGEYIVEDLVQIKALFFQLGTTTTSKKSRTIIIDKIYKRIDNVNNQLNILEHGGIYKRLIELNIVIFFM